MEGCRDVLPVVQRQTQHPHGQHGGNGARDVGDQIALPSFADLVDHQVGDLTHEWSPVFRG